MPLIVNTADAFDAREHYTKYEYVIPMRDGVKLFTDRNVKPALEQGFRPCYSKDMAKVTSKLQVTVPKAVADRYDIRPGDEIEWLVSGDMIRVVPPGKKIKTMSPAERLRRFDLATARQRKRNKRPHAASVQNRGWSRDDLYRRGRSR